MGQPHDQCYTRSEMSIASLDTIGRHLLHVDHPLDLWCHPLRFVCSSFKMEGERQLIGEVVVEMVGEVVVKMVGEVVVKMEREIVVHLSRHYHHYHPLPYLHPILPYPQYLPITRYFHTPSYLPITRYFHTPHILTHHSILLYPHRLIHLLPYPHRLTH